MALMHIDNIQVGGRVRALNEAKVSELAESIRELGLLNPITVSDEGVLVAGYHRLAACRLLAAEDEAYAIVPISYFEHEGRHRQAEIAENLFRHDLSVLERAEHLVLYLEALRASLPAEEQARALGMSRKTLFNYRRIVRDIPEPLRERIKALDHELGDSTRQLLELAALPPDQQEAWLRRFEQPRSVLPGPDDEAGGKHGVQDSTNAGKASKRAPREGRTLTLALPAELQGRLKQTAAGYGLNQGEFTRRLLAQALQALDSGELRLETDEA